MPKPCEEEPHEDITSDIGNLEDDDISLSESMTDDMATVDDSKKIPLGKPSGILARLRAKKQVKSHTYIKVNSKLTKTLRDKILGHQRA